MTTLDDFDAADAAGDLTPEEFAGLPARWLSNGFYTLTFPSGEHRTFRVRTERNPPFRGRRTVALLIGPVNTEDYETRAFVGEAGFEPFRRFRGGKAAEHLHRLWAAAKGEAMEGFGLAVSKRCRLCNRPLTDPVSIETEVGPACRKRVGL